MRSMVPFAIVGILQKKRPTGRETMQRRTCNASVSVRPALLFSPADGNRHLHSNRRGANLLAEGKAQAVAKSEACWKPELLGLNLHVGFP